MANSKEKENPFFAQNTSIYWCYESVKFIEFWHENFPYHLNQMQTKDWNEVETKDYCQFIDNIKYQNRH